MEIIDLRSDTLTRPSAAMRAAMAAAEVGDDVYGEDPTVSELETAVSELLGKPAALFVPSGTMGNQLALLLQTRRGDEVVIGEGAHLAFYEAGAGAAWSGVQFAIAGSGGLFTAAELEAAIKPAADFYPRTSLVALENTHNRGGGCVFPQAEVESIAATARRHSLALHLDGARIWNAAVATGLAEAEIARPFDTVSVCFSKGLGAPVGSALVASKETIASARRYRRMLGGGMRQAGVLAAAALFALRQNRQRLVDDHRAARRLSEILQDGRRLTTVPPETNIVRIELEGLAASEAVAKLKARGVLCNATGPRSLRLVTHLDVTFEQVERAARIMVEELSIA
jgi:threonine aldolase